MESIIDSSYLRYRDISVSEANLNRLQELLDHRMHTARNILKRGISEETRELFVK